MTVPVVWHTWNGGDGRCCWDQDIVEQLTARPVPGRPDYEHLYGGLDELPRTAPGAVVVTPARFQLDHVDAINADLARLKWCVLVLTSDEEALFPYAKLDHPNMRLWVQSPRPDRHPADGTVRFFPVGAPAESFDTVQALPPGRSQTISWCFRGQVNHRQRDEAVAMTRRVGGGQAHPTPGFTLGLDRADYLTELASTRIAPCPSGPASADTFRCWEALECGAVPFVDRGPIPDPEGRAVTDYPDGFWELLCGGRPPFPVLDHWQQAPMLAREMLAAWPAPANRVQAWWQRHKRGLAARLADDVAELSGRGNGTSLADLITVLIPTSPIPAHPDTAVIEETVASVIDRLPGCEIVLMCDGVRAEQEGRRRAYEEYLRRLLWLANHRWGPVFPMVHDRHRHQAAMTRHALEHVRTPLVLFVEHDTPLVGSIPFERLAAVVNSGAANLIRLSHEASVLEPHEHLFLGGVVEVGGVPLRRTVQYSQRPHLASVEFYRRMISTFFGPGARTMIEDVVHGAAQDAWLQQGETGWEWWRLFLYHPTGDIKRSTHLDGRGSDPKYPMEYGW